MEIAIIANDTKKELMTEFCIAYCGILSKHNLCATSITAKYISEATGLEIERLLTGEHGGEEQMEQVALRHEQPARHGKAPAEKDRSDLQPGRYCASRTADESYRGRSGFRI